MTSLNGTGRRIDGVRGKHTVMPHAGVLWWAIVLVAPVVAQADVAWVRDYAVGTPTASTPGSFALDGASAFTWDVDGDGSEDLVAFSGDRLLVQRGDGSVVAWIDGQGSELWKRRRPLMVRVGADRHVVVKPGASGPAPWNAHDQLHVVALFDDPALGYGAGQVIAVAPFSGGGGDDRVFAVLAGGLAAVDPGGSRTLVGVSRNICTVRSYELAVSVAGAVTLVPLAAVACPNTNWIGGNGASVYEIRDAAGQNPEEFLFATEIRRVSDLGVAASWMTLTGTVVPSPQGGTFTLSIGHLVLNHLDTTVVVDRGTPSAPEYWVYALYENGEILAATLNKDAAGQLTLTPRFATRSASYQVSSWGSGAQYLAVTRVAGLGAARRLVAGRYVFDLDGQILADMNAQVADPADRRYLIYARPWWVTPAGAILRDDQYGFGVLGTALVQRYPAPSPANRPFRGTMFNHVWDLEPGLPWSHPPSFRQGYPHFAADTFAIDAAGNVRHRILCIRTQKAAAVLRAVNEQPLVQGPLTQTQRDQILTQVQSAHHMRATDTLDLERAMGL